MVTGQNRMIAGPSDNTFSVRTSIAKSRR